MLLIDISNHKRIIKMVQNGEHPLVSIIVPIYKVEAYVQQCLESLVNQSYKDLEIICVNDGSPDNSGLLLDNYVIRESRMIIINQNNAGLSGARNTGIKAATGTYIMFLDGDDWLDTNTVQDAVEKAEEYVADVVFWCYTREYGTYSKDKHFFWEHGKVFDSWEVKHLLYRRLCGLKGEELAHPEYANAIETAWGKLYRASTIKGVEFIDTKLIGTEDCLYNLYVFCRMKKAVYLDRCYNHYRRCNKGSLTNGYNPYLYERWLVLFKKIAYHIEQNKLGDEFSSAFQNRIALSIIGLGLNQCASGHSLRLNQLEIKKIILSDQYKVAYKQLDMHYFPIYWRVFFESAKQGYSLLLTILLIIIKKLM